MRLLMTAMQSSMTALGAQALILGFRARHFSRPSCFLTRSSPLQQQ
jgi:hypothetical protein